MSALQKILDKQFGTRTPLEQCISDAVTLEDMRDGDYTEQEKAAEKYAEILDVGGRMSNLFFNWSQLDHNFTPAEKKLMKQLQELWDAAVK